MNVTKRILLVDDSRDELQDIQRALNDAPSEWKIDLADSGPLALQKMSLRPFDVVVTDFHMPKMTGEELLRRVMLEYPRTVRIVLSGYFEERVISRLMNTVHQYLCKPCDAMELREAIARALFLRDLLENTELQNLIGRLQSLPHPPVMYTELMIEAQGSRPSLDRIVDIISRDVNVSTRLIHLVNSPFFGLEERVEDVEAAVGSVGLETIKALVLSLQTFATFEKLRKDETTFKPLWNHSWMVGRLAHRLGQAENLESYVIGQSFVAGLMHDVGKLVFLSGVPRQFAAALNLQREKRIPLWMAEREILGCTHAEVGAYLLGTWGLPIPIVETAAQHHHPGSSATRSLSVITTVHAADALDHEMDTPPGMAPLAELDMVYLGELGLKDRMPLWRELRSEVRGRTPALA